jgi:hypothetical protein
MSGSTTTAPTSPPLVKNAYFTYTGGHRDPVQVWNVAVPGGDGKTSNTLEIYVQGDLTGKGFAFNSTAFAKKHLLTFKGGKAAGKSEAITGKMGRILTKRSFAGVSNSQRKDPSKITDSALRTKTEAIIAKYSPTKAPANTYIICDDMTADDLKQRFAKALVAGDDTAGHATVYFPEGSVRTETGTGTPTDKAKDGTGEVPVKIGYSRVAGSGKYAINHLDSA